MLPLLLIAGLLGFSKFSGGTSRFSNLLGSLTGGLSSIIVGWFTSYTIVIIVVAVLIFLIVRFIFRWLTSDNFNKMQARTSKQSEKMLPLLTKVL